jgi:hypothetical protein
MKYLDSYDTKVAYVDDIKKFLSHLILVFSELGFDYSNYYDRDSYEIMFEKRSNRAFNVTIDPFEHNLKLELSINYQNIYDYFKTLSGLSEKSSTPVFHSSKNKYLRYIVRFEINGQISKLINQISKEDFEFKMNAEKYNL